jgi:hypothetical protein
VNEMTREEQLRYVDRFIEGLRKKMEDAIELDVNADFGTTTRWAVGHPYPSINYNGTYTFVIKINGGAVHS